MRIAPITRRELATLAIAGSVHRAQGRTAFGTMLWDYFREYLRVLDERRAERLAALESSEDFDRLRQRVRRELGRMWGAFPERTPLNPETIGTLDRTDHWVEKIVFESRPEFPVTANLYRPKADTRVPAVIFPCGHAAAGKAAESYQRFAVLLARNGLAVLTWDPLGQGERLQFWSPEKDGSEVQPGTPEHRILGNQCYLLGDNLMQYRAWDATRALDYLESRPEIDSARLGIAGQSGGGMVALQFACFDDRIKAAFSSCAVASFKAKTEALLIADPEQILAGTLRALIDHPELLAAFAPKPLLIGSALRDYVPIAGARRTWEELRAVYSKLGASDALGMVETDAPHGLNRELREAGAAFFLKALAGRQERVSEEPAEILSERELACTSTGQVSTALHAKSVAQFNVERLAAIRPKLPPARNASEFEVYRSDVAHRIRAVTKVGAFKSEFGIEVPSRFLDAGVYAKGAVFLVAEQGKDHPVVRRYCIDAVIAANHGAYGLDLRGWGATDPSLPSLDVDFDWDDFFAYRSLELGRPLFGQRLKDLLASAPQQTKWRDWIVVGIGIGGLIAAHAAALDERIAGVASIEAPLSYASMVKDSGAEQPVSAILPGVLAAYEIRDVYAALAPRPLLIVNPQDARRRGVTEAEARSELASAMDTYDMLESRDSMQVVTGLGRSGLRSQLEDWLTGLAA